MKWAKCSATLDSPWIHRFFLNLSDSFSFALLSSDAVSLCFRFRSLAQSCLLPLPLHFGSRTIFFTHRLPPSQTNTTWPWPAPFWLLPNHVAIASWSDQYYVLIVWGRDHRNRPHTIKVWRIYIYIHTYIRESVDSLCRDGADTKYMHVI